MCCLMASVSLVSIAWLLTSNLSSHMRTNTCALNGSGKMFGLHSICGRAKRQTQGTKRRAESAREGACVRSQQGCISGVCLARVFTVLHQCCRIKRIGYVTTPRLLLIAYTRSLSLEQWSEVKWQFGIILQYSQALAGLVWLGRVRCFGSATFLVGKSRGQAIHAKMLLA